MSQREDFEETIKLIRQLLPLIEANQEIAVMRIGKVRSTVLATRSFEEGLSAVYSSVLASHKQAIAEEQEVDVVDGKAAAILLSTNERLAGSITQVTTTEYIKFTDENPKADVIIVGQVGRDVWESKRPNKPYLFFDLPRQAVSMNQIRPLLSQLIEYQDLTVFYPRFSSVVTQEPVIRQLGSALDAAMQASHNKPLQGTRYLFEPSLEKVLDFFNTQIFSTVVKQLFEETELAILGSRITAMENAAFNIRRRLAQLEQLDLHTSRRDRNKHQRERLAGMRLWHTS